MTFGLVQTNYLYFFVTKVSNQPIPNKVTTKTVRTRVLGLAKRLALPRRVVDFCGTFPIYNAVKVPLDSMNTTLYKIQGKNSSSSSSSSSSSYCCDNLFYFF